MGWHRFCSKPYKTAFADRVGYMLRLIPRERVFLAHRDEFRQPGAVFNLFAQLSEFLALPNPRVDAPIAVRHQRDDAGAKRPWYCTQSARYYGVLERLRTELHGEYSRMAALLASFGRFVPPSVIQRLSHCLLNE